MENQHLYASAGFAEPDPACYQGSGSDTLLNYDYGSPSNWLPHHQQGFYQPSASDGINPQALQHTSPHQQQYHANNGPFDRFQGVQSSLMHQSASPQCASEATSEGCVPSDDLTWESESSKTEIDMSDCAQFTGEEMSSKAYAAHLYHCLASTAPNYEMALQDIYTWYRKNTRRGRTSTNEKAWMNSIRHNLSMNNGFQNFRRTNDAIGKKSVWSLSDEVINAGRIQPTTRFRKVDSKGRRTSSSSSQTASKTGARSKARRTAKKQARRNPPRDVQRQGATEQSSSSTSAAASPYSPMSSGHSSADANAYGSMTVPPSYAYTASVTSTPLTGNQPLPYGPTSSFSPHFQANATPHPLPPDNNASFNAHFSRYQDLNASGYGGGDPHGTYPSPSQVFAYPAATYQPLTSVPAFDGVGGAYHQGDQQPYFNHVDEYYASLDMHQFSLDPAFSQQDAQYFSGN